MKKYLGLKPGSVSPFGLINDINKEVHLFIDENLKTSKLISFHPNINTASLVITFNNFISFIKSCGNLFEFIDLVEK